MTRIRATAEYDGWYIPSRETFVALKKECNGQQPRLAFPPATEQQLKETQRQLGFPLPLLLRLLYTQIANGGFGPGYGIIGAIDGFSLLDGFGDDIVLGYQQAIAYAKQLGSGSLLVIQAHPLEKYFPDTASSPPFSGSPKVIPLANPFKPHHRGEQKQSIESERGECHSPMTCCEPD